MRGLTLFIETTDPARFRAALTLACAQRALGGRVRLFCHEQAVSMLAPGKDAGDAARGDQGLPDRSQLLAMARDSGVVLIACQTGLALTGRAQTDLLEGVEIGGHLTLLAELGDDRLLAF